MSSTPENDRITELTEQKDTAYAERDRCVAGLAALAVRLGWSAWLGRHEPDPKWDQDWMTIVFINLPTGQVSWHIHDSEVEWFSFLPTIPERTWDGHATEQKYNRLAAIADDVEPYSKTMEVGREAEELRVGIERIMADPPGGDDESNDEWIAPLRRLLDRVDARDSLGYLERRSRSVQAGEGELRAAHVSEKYSGAGTQPTTPLDEMLDNLIKGVHSLARADGPSVYVKTAKALDYIHRLALVVQDTRNRKPR